jgi:hypothetical protein
MEPLGVLATPRQRQQRHNRDCFYNPHPTTQSYPWKVVKAGVIVG